jgi:hypothetical protein
VGEKKGLGQKTFLLVSGGWKLMNNHTHKQGACDTLVMGRIACVLCMCSFLWKGGGVLFTPAKKMTQHFFFVLRLTSIYRRGYYARTNGG